MLYTGAVIFFASNKYYILGSLMTKMEKSYLEKDRISVTKQEFLIKVLVERNDYTLPF